MLNCMLLVNPCHYNDKGEKSVIVEPTEMLNGVRVKTETVFG